jgi:outer membrane protein assembly factor BamA
MKMVKLIQCNKFQNFLLALCSVLIIASCRVPYEQPRVKKVKVIGHSGNYSEYEASGYIRQKPNKKILFVFPFHLGVHNMASHLSDNSAKKSIKIDNKVQKLKEKNKPVDYIKFEKKRQRTFRSWLMETIGEAPVLYDSILTAQSEKQIQLYLKTTGHFNAEVKSELIPNRTGRKAKVHYHIFGGTPYLVNDFSWFTPDNRLSSSLNGIMKGSLISKGMQYNEDVFDNERDRITSELRNSGFFHFSKQYISFNADTTVGNYQTDLQLYIKPFGEMKTDSTETTFIQEHPVSKTGDIFFNLDFRHDGSNISLLDTTIVQYTQNKKALTSQTYYFLHEGPLKYRPKTLLKKNHFRSGEIVKISHAIKTNNGLASLGNFRYINIRFNEKGSDSSGFMILDVHIDLTRNKKQTYSTEIEGTHSSGKLGISANLSYRNRNTFKGAEALTFRLRGAVEAQTLITAESDENSIFESLPFNTIETGFETEFILPTFLMPFTEGLFTEKNVPKTAFTAGGLFQQRPDYTRYIGNFSLTYDWRETATKQHLLTPFINVVRIFPDSSFAARIEQFSRPLQTSYKDHFINGIRYTYTLSAKTGKRAKNAMLFRGNIENAGFIPFTYSRLFAGSKPGQTFYVLGIRFAQYTKADIDIRQYFNFAQNSALVFRLFTGLGIPYGNIDVLPFDKRYSAGGSNDIRAWKFRSLGPGTYTDRSNFDKTGDISIVTNLEYRFPIYGILHSAIFIDAGNIWMLKEYEDYPGGTFKAESFIKQFAIGAGLGVRLNFGFFIFRLDAGFPFHDPALPENERWVGFSKFIKRTNLNFGIGYPF